MTDHECVDFLQWALPRLGLRWPGFRKVRRQVRKRIDRRTEQLGFAGIAAYRNYLQQHPDEWRVLDGFCRITISRFYRDRSVYDFVRDRVLPESARAAADHGEREVRLWCAGCASGEEPYTLAIVWRECLAARFPALRLRLLATDVDQQMLDRARKARFSAGSLKDLPAEWITAAFDRSDDQYVLKPELAAGIEFRRQDLRSELPDGPFHVILCRHVAFTYFDQSWQRKILRQVLASLVPGGFLITGKQEPLPAGAPGISAYGRNLGIYRVADLAADQGQEIRGSS